MTNGAVKPSHHPTTSSHQRGSMMLPNAIEKHRGNTRVLACAKYLKELPLAGIFAKWPSRSRPSETRKSRPSSAYSNGVRPRGSSHENLVPERV